MEEKPRADQEQTNGGFGPSSKHPEPLLYLKQFHDFHDWFYTKDDCTALQ